MKFFRLLEVSVLFLVLSFFITPLQICLAEERLDNKPNEVQLSEAEYLQGRVSEILEEKIIHFEEENLDQKYQKLKIFVTKGSLTGKDIIIENGSSPMSNVITYSVGDVVIISYSKGIDGSDSFYIADFVRTDGILILFILFVVLAIIVGSKKGFFALLSMAISFGILFLFVLPQIQAGKDPVFIAILASVVIIPVTFYLSHGFEKKTTIAIIGTIIALLITGLLSSAFVNMTHLSGAVSEEALFLNSMSDVQYNLKGLLLAGIIIGTLGVMDDITVSQTAIVGQLYDLKKELSRSELFKRSIQIGKDHIASMINTLVLVYTGASLPLLLLFMNNPRPFDEILSLELITTEVVRTLVGSIGLILAVPITTYLACLLIKRDE